MKQEELSELTDQELLEEAKKIKSASMIIAVFIGVMIEIVTYCIVKNTFGFLSLITFFCILWQLKIQKTMRTWRNF
ncbi:hypothetical protein [Pedobacter sp. JCM 36344]|uniref:hypothetical protein n=1 Tax=Pedobacter sp. JCM 36344 TaxID=3374280 RepID=UPI0039799318